MKFFRRFIFLIAYHFYLKRKLATASTVRVLGFQLTIPSTVFHPKYYFSSKFLGAYLSTLDLIGKNVLDMGCGSGIFSIIAASRRASVISVDLNERAVEATIKNAKENQLEHSVTTFHGNLFDPLSGNSRFDLMLFNPPFYPDDPGSASELAWKGGKNYEVVSQFISQSPKYLNKDGKILVVLSSDMDLDYVRGLFTSSNFSIQRIETRRTMFDTLYIYEAKQYS